MARKLSVLIALCSTLVMAAPAGAASWSSKPTTPNASWCC